MSPYYLLWSNQIVRLQHGGVEFGEIEMLWRTNLQQQESMLGPWSIHVSKPVVSYTCFYYSC
jgi:hypothetical protein